MGMESPNIYFSTIFFFMDCISPTSYLQSKGFLSVYVLSIILHKDQLWFEFLGSFLYSFTL